MEPISSAQVVLAAAKLLPKLFGRGRRRKSPEELRREADVARRFENQERAKRGQPLLPPIIGTTVIPPPRVPSPGPTTRPPVPPDTVRPAPAPAPAPTPQPEPIPGDRETDFPDDERMPAGYGGPDYQFEDLPPLPGEVAAGAGVAGMAGKDYVRILMKEAKESPLGKLGAKLGRARKAGNVGRAVRVAKLPVGPVGIAVTGAAIINEAINFKNRKFAELEKQQTKILKDSDKAANRAARKITGDRAKAESQAEREQAKAATAAYRAARLAQTDRAFRAQRTDKALDAARARAARANRRVTATSKALDREIKAREKAQLKAQKATAPKPPPKTRGVRLPNFQNVMAYYALAQAVGTLFKNKRGGSGSGSRLVDSPPPRVGDFSPTPGLTPGYSPALGFAGGLSPSALPSAALQSAEKCYTVCRKPGRKKRKKTKSKRICYERKI